MNINNKPLMSRWQEILSGSNHEALEPHVTAAMHAMFMSGASAALGLISNAPDEEGEAVVRAMADELNTWADNMNLAIRKAVN